MGKGKKEEGRGEGTKKGGRRRRGEGKNRVTGEERGRRGLLTIGFYSTLQTPAAAGEGSRFAAGVT